MARCRRCGADDGLGKKPYKEATVPGLVLVTHKSRVGTGRDIPWCADWEACDDRLSNYDGGEAKEDFYGADELVDAARDIRPGNLALSVARRALKAVDKVRARLVRRIAPCGHQECLDHPGMAEDCRRAAKGLPAARRKRQSNGMQREGGELT